MSSLDSLHLAFTCLIEDVNFTNDEEDDDEADDVHVKIETRQA